MAGLGKWFFWQGAFVLAVAGSVGVRCGEDARHGRWGVRDRGFAAKYGRTIFFGSDVNCVVVQQSSRGVAASPRQDHFLWCFRGGSASRSTSKPKSLALPTSEDLTSSSLRNSLCKLSQDKPQFAPSLRKSLVTACLVARRGVISWRESLVLLLRSQSSAKLYPTHRQLLTNAPSSIIPSCDHE